MPTFLIYSLIFSFGIYVTGLCTVFMKSCKKNLLTSTNVELSDIILSGSPFLHLAPLELRFAAISALASCARTCLDEQHVGFVRFLRFSVFFSRGWDFPFFLAPPPDFPVTTQSSWYKSSILLSVLVLMCVCDFMFNLSGRDGNQIYLLSINRRLYIELLDNADFGYKTTDTI